MKTIWYLLRPYQKRLWVLGVLSIFVGYVQSAQIAVLYPILNASLGQSNTPRGGFVFDVLNRVTSIIPVNNPILSSTIIFIALTVFIFVCKILYTQLSATTISGVTTAYKEKVFTRFTHSDYQFYVDSRQGDLLYRARNAPESINTALNGLTQVVVQVIVGISILVMMFSISWKATLLVIAVGAVYYYFGRFVAFRVSYATGKEFTDVGQEENVVVNEYISGIKQILTSNVQSQWLERFTAAARTRWKAWAKYKVWQEIPQHAMEFVLYFGVALIVIIILSIYPNRFFSLIPLFGTFAFALFRLMPPITITGTQLMVMLNTTPDLELVQHLLGDETYSKIKNGAHQFNGLETGIQFRDVSYTHAAKGHATLSDVSLTLDKNKMTAVVGRSGAGKSTIINLLLRLYDVDAGAILIDGINIREYNLQSFLSKIGFVSQETFISNASVAANIAFGGTYSSEEIVEAARFANADEFIRKMPQGYDTVVGDQGARLSGGERQRLAIARAIVKKPQILVLDEATSSLDTVSERLVQDALDRAVEGCTTLVVAHRLSTIQNAHMIYVVDNGRVVESGNHQELISKGGTYSALYHTQDSSVKK